MYKIAWQGFLWRYTDMKLPVPLLEIGNDTSNENRDKYTHTQGSAMKLRSSKYICLMHFFLECYNFIQDIIIIFNK